MSVDYEALAQNGMSADQLANTFLKEYFSDTTIQYPVNPFQMLKDMGVKLTLRPFKKYEGIYIPAADDEDFPVVGINLNRSIARQRYTAAHELCHHLKDLHLQDGFACAVNGQSSIEKYAEKFAAELLMPTDELKEQVDKRAVDGYINLDGVLQVAEFFGVSFLSCLYKIAYRLHMIEGDTDPNTLKKQAAKFKPAIKRKELRLDDTVLYEQLFDAIGEDFQLDPTAYVRERFKIEYIYHDSRLEGIDISQEEAAVIITDLRLYKQESEYCKEENQNIIEVAGLTFVYDYVFENASPNINIYDAKHLNEKLFSTAPQPEYGGKYRESNTLVLGAKFETIDYQKIQEEMYYLGKEIDMFMRQMNDMSLSQYIERVIQIHHRLTVIHAFRDGNGRTSRAFANMMLQARNVPPVFFRDKEKDDYKEALKNVDLTGSFGMLYDRFYKSILNSYAMLSDFSIR